MPPAVPIDSDLDPFDSTILSVAELDALWKATTLGGGLAAWAQVFDVANFDAALGSALVIDRVRCAKDTQNLVYSIGHGLGTDGVTYKEFCGRSSNGGQTWNWYEIGEIDAPGEEFTIGASSGAENGTTTTFGGGSGLVTCSIQFLGTQPFNNSQRQVYLQFPEEFVHIGGTELAIEYDVTGDFPSNTFDTAADAPPTFPAGSFPSQIVNITSTTPIEGGLHCEGIFYPAGISWGDYSKLLFGWRAAAEGKWTGMSTVLRASMMSNLIIDGVAYGAQPSRAFDVAPTQGSWLYYGATDRVWKSEDGGATWAILLEDTGAYDICVDPQAAGAIYFWGVDGNLNLAVVDVVTSTGLMTETALNIPLRIARDPSSGRLLALPNGTTLTMRNLGSNTDLKTGLTGATGLHAYPGQKIIFLDDADIWISDNIQAVSPTITAKQGGWSEYAGGVNAHRMQAIA